MEGILKREVVVSRGLSRFITVAVFIILTSLGGFVRIPLGFTPVPLTLQTFFVLLCGAFLGSGLGAFTQLSYVSLGFLGLPVFTGNAGIVSLFGPTAGYLFGFILAAAFIGKFIRQAKNFYAAFALFCLADFLLLACGSLWLKILLGLPLAKAFLIGFVPFIPGDFVKAFAACAAYWKLRSRVKEIF